MNKKVKILGAILLSLLFLAGTTSVSAKDCVTKDMKTSVGKKACAEGGQNAAKKAWKAWVKEAKKKDCGVKDCKSCHKKTSGNYDLKPDAEKTYKACGGT